jgi:hypothetical protein
LIHSGESKTFGRVTNCEWRRCSRCDGTNIY